MHLTDFKNQILFLTGPTILLAFSLLVLTGCQREKPKKEYNKYDDPKFKAALSQVERIASELDQKTNESGVYIRAEAGELKEKDPWGTPLQLSYSQGGVAETVTVTSAGRDKKFHTDDDAQAQGVAVNFKGVGEGIKKNAEETASNAAKGLVKGTVEGVKESIKDSLPFRKKKKEEEPEAEKAPESGPETKKP